MRLTVAPVVMDFITDGCDAREHHGRVVDELHEKRIELERMRRQVAELAALVRGLADATSPASILAGQETTGGQKGHKKRASARCLAQTDLSSLPSPASGCPGAATHSHLRTSLRGVK